MFEWGDFLFAEGGASSDRAVAKVLQHSAAAQFVRISSAGADGMDRGGVGMVLFSSPAGGSIKPAAAGVQALTMNSPGSAWTPVLAGLKQLIAGEGKIRSLNRRVILSIELVQNIGQATPESRSTRTPAPSPRPARTGSAAFRCGSCESPRW